MPYVERFARVAQTSEGVEAKGLFISGDDEKVTMSRAAYLDLLSDAGYFVVQTGIEPEPVILWTPEQLTDALIRSGIVTKEKS